jgi:hypothetical protein
MQPESLGTAFVTGGSREGHAMGFEARTFLADLSYAYNVHDLKTFRSFFALDDPRFCIFEEFSGELLYAGDYERILSLAEEATGAMSFEVLDSRVYGDFALVHALQKIEDPMAWPGKEESVIRVTLFLAMREGTPRILSGHLSSMMLCFPKVETVIRFRNLGKVPCKDREEM